MRVDAHRRELPRKQPVEKSEPTQTLKTGSNTSASSPPVTANRIGLGFIGRETEARSLPHTSESNNTKLSVVYQHA